MRPQKEEAGSVGFDDNGLSVQKLRKVLLEAVIENMDFIGGVKNNEPCFLTFIKVSSQLPPFVEIVFWVVMFRNEKWDVHFPQSTHKNPYD